MKRLRWLLPAAALSLACNALIGAPTTTPVPEVTATPSPQPNPIPEAAQFIAYAQDGQLLVTDVTGGVKGGTTQYTNFGAGSEVREIEWSPDGQFVAFVAAQDGQSPYHVYNVFAVGAGEPVDLGEGGYPAWRPDENTGLILQKDNAFYQTGVDVPELDPITNEPERVWGNAVFTPDAAYLITSSALPEDMGASGNTQFVLERVSVNTPTGERTPLPGFTQPLQGRLPIDLSFSPDGKYLGFTSSFHLSACAAPGEFFMYDADGSTPRGFTSPELAEAMQTGGESYHTAFGYAWNPASSAVAIAEVAYDCKDFAGTLLGAQISVFSFDGTQRLIIPGTFSSLSFDRKGEFIAAVREVTRDPYQSNVEIYSAQTGERVLDLGPGTWAQFQP